MVFKAKQKGNLWEHDAVELLTKLIKKSKWKRIPGSGAIGTSMDEPLLTGDITGNVESLPKKIKLEAKVGYGGAKQFALKKEWLDKVKEEAKNNYSIPMLIGKFSGARGGVQSFVVMDTETFSDLINYITELKDDIDTYVERDNGKDL